MLALGFQRIVVQNDLSVNSKLFSFANDSYHQTLAVEYFVFSRSLSTMDDHHRCGWGSGYRHRSEQWLRHEGQGQNCKKRLCTKSAGIPMERYFECHKTKRTQAAPHHPNWDAAFTMQGPRVAPEGAFRLITNLQNVFDLA